MLRIYFRKRGSCDQWERNEIPRAELPAWRKTHPTVRFEFIIQKQGG